MTERLSFSLFLDRVIFFFCPLLFVLIPMKFKDMFLLLVFRHLVQHLDAKHNELFLLHIIVIPE